jgi:hypothetical protein
MWSVIPVIVEHMLISAKGGDDLRHFVFQVAFLLGEVAGVVGLLSAIGICAFLHTLRIIIISAITATPSCLGRKRVSQGEDPRRGDAYQNERRSRDNIRQIRATRQKKWLGREVQWIRCRKEES